MSWGNLFGFSGSKDKNVPILNALEQQRVKQIESLRTFHPRYLLCCHPDLFNISSKFHSTSLIQNSIQEEDLVQVYMYWYIYVYLFCI